MSFLRISASYDLLFLIALSKIVGLDVNPLTDNSWMHFSERAAIQQITRYVVEP